MIHNWKKLHSEESDNSCYPIWYTNISQCENCRIVKRNMDTSGYCTTPEEHHIHYSVAGTWINHEPPCSDKIGVGKDIIDEMKRLQANLLELEKKVHLK